MSTLAVDLDNTLNTLPPSQAVELQRQVRRLLQHAQTSVPVADSDELTAKGWPKDFWTQIHALWGEEPFERPEQLPEQKREEW